MSEAILQNIHSESGEKSPVQFCDKCALESKPNWKYCGRCGSYLLKSSSRTIKYQNNEIEEKLKNEFKSRISTIEQNRNRFRRDKKQMTFAVTFLEVDNGARVERSLNELHRKDCLKGVWEKPPKMQQSPKNTYYKDFDFPIQPPRPILEPLKHVQPNPSLQNSQDWAKSPAESSWFWGEAKLDHPKPVDVLWNSPKPMEIPEEVVPAEIIDEATATLLKKKNEKEEKEKEKSILMKKLEAWPNGMGKKFRQCVNSMKNTIQLCDVDILNYGSRDRIAHLNDILEKLLHDIHTSKTTMHIINEEQKVFYSEIDYFRIKVTDSLAAALKEYAATSSIPMGSGDTVGSSIAYQDWEHMLPEVEEKQKEDVDSILRLRLYRDCVLSGAAPTVLYFRFHKL